MIPCGNDDAVDSGHPSHYPLPAAEVIALLDAGLEASGYVIETRDVSELQGVWQFTKGGLPGMVHVFPSIGDETSININLFTAGVR